MLRLFRSGSQESGRPQPGPSIAKRFSLVVLLLAGLASPSPGALTGTAHDMGLSGDDPCAVCHLPPSKDGTLVWAIAPLVEGTVGTVAGLCGSCHHSAGGFGALLVRANSDDNVYGPNSHGQKMKLADPPPATDVAGSGLPRVDEAHGNFECTTCHNVHDDTYRPFLRDSLTALCARCHTRRHYVSGEERSGRLVETGAWGVPPYLGAGNPGSHPVGEDVTGERPGGPAVAIPEPFRVPLAAEPGEWSLGGHLTQGASGGVTCVTCHAVHGSEADDDGAETAVVSRPPNPAFLVVPQAGQALTGSPRVVPNGAGSSNALCESCHGVGNNPSKAPGAPSWSASEHNVNPGKPGTYSHPVDSYPSSVDAGVKAFPSGWPVGDPLLAGTNVAPVPLCETCHAPHPAAALAAARGDVRPGAGPSLLRSPLGALAEPGLCDLCHTEGLSGHHPTGKAYDSSGVPYLANAKKGPGDRLDCATCHTTAHGWTEPSWAGLDAQWKPRDNGRSTVQAVDMYNPDMSKTCMDCHYFMDGDGASVSPTLGSKQTVIAPAPTAPERNPSDGEPAPVPYSEFSHYQTPDRSMGTHYIGLIHEGGAWQRNPLVNVLDKTRTWEEQSADPQYSAGLARGWSRFGGADRPGGRVLVCESCHELEPDKNVGFRHLLLAPYQEGQSGLGAYPGDTDGRDVLCEACHGVPTGTHPMTNAVVSKTGQVLDANAPWLRPVSLGYAAMDRVRNALSCDSCHQPHDANSNSFTFILDAPLTGTIGAYDPPVGVGVTERVQPSEAVEFGYHVARKGGESSYATPTLEGTGGSYAGFCAQCHDK